MMSNSILLVDDNPLNQIVTSHILTKWGHEVTIANDGKEALEKITNKRFGLVLMDIQMPVMDGYEATHHIRSLDNPYYKKVPIIAFTASSLVDTKEKAESIGMTDFLLKPLNTEEMQQKIDLYMLKPAKMRHSKVLRPLQINFETYASGNPELQTDIIELIKDNMRALQQATHNAYHLKEYQNYHHVSNRAKNSILLLNDLELTSLYESLNKLFHNLYPIDAKKINTFIQIIADILESLEIEFQLASKSKAIL
jgi:CheY-like chemotaxis protein